MEHECYRAMCTLKCNSVFSYGRLAIRAALREYSKHAGRKVVFGLSALLTMLGGLFWTGGRACGRSANTQYKPLCAGMLAALIGFMVQSFFECLWEEPYLMALFFVVAAMLTYTGFFLRKKES